MLNAKRPLGFGDIKQTAEFFGISQTEVRRRGASGRWPSYIIGGRRVFDVDAVLELLAKESPAEHSPQEVVCHAD